MICSQCGLYISDPSAQTCPRCGQFLTTRPDSAFGSAPTPTDAAFPASQPAQSGFPAPAASQWMKPSIAPAYAPPVRRRSRKRRNILALVVIGLIIAACVGYSYFTFSGPGHQPTSSNTLPGSNVLFSDPLNSAASGWSNDTNHCLFEDNAYHVKNSIVCFAPAGNIGDANITVQAKQIAGSLLEGYGISFRRASSGNRYDFDINGNSQWAFFKVVNNTASALVDFAPSPAIKGGLNTINSLRVEIKGSHFIFFVNGTQVGAADDTTFASGEVGLAASGTTTEVAYTNFEIDKVS